jgi:hypothetical protein
MYICAHRVQYSQVLCASSLPRTSLPFPSLPWTVTSNCECTGRCHAPGIHNQPVYCNVCRGVIVHRRWHLTIIVPPSSLPQLFLLLTVERHMASGTDRWVHNGWALLEALVVALLLLAVEHLPQLFLLLTVEKCMAEVHMAGHTRVGPPGTPCARTSTAGSRT